MRRRGRRGEESSTYLDGDVAAGDFTHIEADGRNGVLIKVSLADEVHQRRLTTRL